MVRLSLFTVVLLIFSVHRAPVYAQPLDQVLTSLDHTHDLYSLPIDRGSTGLWQKLQKLQTTASVMHTTAHPDDEHAGLLTYLSRGKGVRTALLTLNRGEAGANATGAELFDGLGLVRTEELLRSGAYYGLDDQYFTSLIDYGYSKTLQEAMRSWGRENVLREMVRVIRTNRPLVVISRFYGGVRDGHGHHQAAGGITPEAVAAAGDPNRFPEQISEEGLRPWKALKVYRGGIRENEPYHVRVDVGQYNPWIGSSYYDFGYRGLSLQRSQTSGRSRTVSGPSIWYYERLRGPGGNREEAGFFDGLDTSLAGVYTLFGRQAPANAAVRLSEIQGAVDEALAEFDIEEPARVVAALVRGLNATRELLQEPALNPDVAFVMHVKARQFEDAIQTALGLHMHAVAMPADAHASNNPWLPLPTMGSVVPGQSFKVGVEIVNPSSMALVLESVSVRSAYGLRPQEVNLDRQTLVNNEVSTFEVTVQTPDDVAYSRPYFYRTSITEDQYRVLDGEPRHVPHKEPALVVAATYSIDGVPMTLRRTVQARASMLPYGYKLEPLTLAPRVVVNTHPEVLMVPIGAQERGGRPSFDVHVEVVNNDEHGLQGNLLASLPGGWTASPASIPFSFDQAGERSTYTFEITAVELSTEAYEVKIQAEVDGRGYGEGYDVIQRRELQTRHLYKPARVMVRGVEVYLAPNLDVGYIMGVGDEVPAGIEQLGARVTLLGEEDLAQGDLSTYDAIVVGTRAYAVRQDLLTYNQRLMDFTRAGGNLVVLYQTPEFVPDRMAPYPASLPRFAEEVSEQDAPVRILAARHPVLNTPNEITEEDFEKWVEQRGSKFFASWDGRYHPVIETADTGQAPQRGAWLVAQYGNGWYTYLALAIHRQTPYSVPGPARILANVLSLGIHEAPISGR